MHKSIPFHAKTHSIPCNPNGRSMQACMELQAVHARFTWNGASLHISDITFVIYHPTLTGTHKVTLCFVNLCYVAGKPSLICAIVHPTTVTWYVVASELTNSARGLYNMICWKLERAQWGKTIPK